MRSCLLAALFVCLPALQAAEEPARRIAVMVDGADRAERDLYLGLLQIYRPRERVLSYELQEAQRSDPIAKGRLLSALQTCDLVVAVGNGAAEFAVSEVEDVPVYFVDATVVPGRSLEAASVSGLFGYSVEDLLDAVKVLRLGPVGLAYTPGYEPVAELVRQGASARGLAVVARKIGSAKELAPAVRSLLERARVIWLAGDPLLVRGAGFEFVQENTLSAAIPVVGSGAWDVSHGALLGSAPNAAQQEAEAVRTIDSILQRRPGAGPRLKTAGRGGVILINAALAARWKVRAPEDARWRRVR
ncbi:MAG TPA: ABC transporter substrate binding protein [Elusimicrobiota bacterium]|nr:ABC transporter substrate binding protein [Elusimicrobiota bacterium]